MGSAQLDTAVAWLRAASLSERLAAGPPAPDASVVTERDERRLARWRQREPFDDPALWRERLRADGLDEARLLALLSEPPADLASRLSVPDWVTWLESALDVTGSMPTAANPPLPAGWSLDPADAFLAPVMQPLLEAAQRGLADELRRLPGRSFEVANLVDQLASSLRQLVHRMLSRTLTLELHLARVRGTLTGATPEERFGSFLEDMASPARRRRLLTDYPVLGRQLAVAAAHWHGSSRRLAERIVADTAAIRDRFAAGAELGPVDEVTIGRGDAHRGGQSVAIVRWACGLALAYKPRPLAVDVAFDRLLEWLNERLSLPLRRLTYLDRGDYGWVEFVEAAPCAGAGEIGRFYHRQGALLALLQLLRAGDIHAENLIAAGEQPVPVDLETLFQPPSPLPEPGLTAAERRATDAASASVLQIGLLPSLVWRTRDGRGVDLSGIGNRPGQRTSMAMPVLSGVGTDTMKVELQRLPLGVPDHRPVATDVRLNLLDYADDLAAGFAEVHRLCRTSRDALLADDGPLAAFRGAPIRVLLRPTMAYSTVLWTGFHPDLLRDGMDRDRHFDYLWRQVRDTPAIAACIPAERRDLWCGDIPYFHTRTDSDQLLDSNGEPVPGIRLEPGLDQVRRGLAGWDAQHLDTQLWMIRGALAAAAINDSGELVYPDYALPVAGRAATADELLAAADAIGDRLAGLALTEADSAQWLGLMSYLGQNWTLGPLGPDLFNGLSGIALFLAELGRATGDRRYTELARRAVATVGSQVAREMLAGLGGMAGVPGVVYALCRLSRLLEDESLVDTAAAMSEPLVSAVRADVEYDIVAGSAGTISALRLLHLMRPEGPAASVIAVAADRLRATGEPHGGGLAWMPNNVKEAGWSDVPLAGLSHGSAGVAWALAEAGRLLGDGRHAQLAREALAHERSLFDPTVGTWRDLRAVAGAAAEICAWCHGAVGIGLARLACRDALADDPVLDREIAAAVDTTRRDGFGLSHCLCHGDTGSLDLLVTAARALGRQELRTEAGLRAAAVLASVDKHGPLCGVPFGTPTPGLMVGLAGIGYGFLRVASPDRVPSVLTLEPSIG